MSHEPSIPNAAELDALFDQPEALRDPLVGYKAFDMVFDVERQTANVYSPTERQFEWWSVEEGAVHHHLTPPLCMRSGRYTFQDEKGNTFRKGWITQPGHTANAPVDGCDCGYWMFGRLEDAKTSYGNLVASPSYAKITVRQRRIYCLVFGDGKSFLNEISFRSRFLTFAAIPRIEGAERYCEMMAEDYGIECLTYEEMEEYRVRAGIDPLALRKEMGE